MGFLDNSGDIILDAVLTDLGRKRLAEGSFTVTQFALGDDEINYSLYNPSHPSGSSYYDLEILQTPVLESFTNNTSTMKSRLITLDALSNVLYLPILKESNVMSATKRHSSGTFLVAVDEKTQVTRTEDLTASPLPTRIGKVSGAIREGVLFGFTPSAADNYISIHHGIDNLNKPKSIALSSELQEQQYIIQIDGRFGKIMGPKNDELSNNASVIMTEDDDGFLFYTVELGGGDDIVVAINENTNSPILGSRGTAVSFKIKASDNLIDNDAYFDRFGFTTTINSISCKVIDSAIRVTGLNLGYSIDIPVRYVKDKS